jgi:hypothetical protein
MLIVLSWLLNNFIFPMRLFHFIEPINFDLNRPHLSHDEFY